MIVPLGDRVLVEQQKKEVRASGIILDEESEDSLKIPRGVVVSLGEKVEEGLLAVGDVIFFNAFSGERVQYEEKEHLLLRTSEILAKVRV